MLRTARRLQLTMNSVALAVSLHCGTRCDGAEPPSAIDVAPAWPGAVAPELHRIRQELGGPAVDRFPTLQAAPPAVWSTDRDRNASHRDRPQVEALREAASQLDVTANRLELLELYQQADALRTQAQQLRVDARGMTGGSAPTASPAARMHRSPVEAAPGAPAATPSQGHAERSVTHSGSELAPTPTPENRRDPQELTPVPLQE